MIRVTFRLLHPEETPMEVHRNLRTPKAGPGRLRMVRIVGDGTPPNTRILDGRGEPLEELVTSYSVQGDAKGCARGAFIFLETGEDGQVVIDPETNAPLEGTFEAWVVYEQPHELDSAANQVDRLTRHILEHVPDEPSESEGAVDTAVRLLRELVEVPADGERFWMCKIGPVPRGVAPRVALDHPMRTAVEGAFRFLFGVDAEVIFSGWGAHLTTLEREVLEEDRKADEVGGIGTVDGPVLDRASDAPPECFAEPRDGGTKECAVPVETDEKAFARLAPGPGHGGGIIPPDSRGYKV